MLWNTHSEYKVSTAPKSPKSPKNILKMVGFYKSTKNLLKIEPSPKRGQKLRKRVKINLSIAYTGHILCFMAILEITQTVEGASF